ncbi:hypothetical protein E3Q09_02800 [Wallemia mellicola]|nr:hypothetical protein E3Q09_02800 [Wallemia mellicola]
MYSRAYCNTSYTIYRPNINLIPLRFLPPSLYYDMIINSLNGEITEPGSLDENSLLLDDAGNEVESLSTDQIVYLFNRHQLKSFYKDSVRLYTTPLHTLSDYIAASHYHLGQSQHLHTTSVNRHNSIRVALNFIKRQLSLLDELRSDFDTSSTTLLQQHSALLHHHQFHMHLVANIPISPKLEKRKEHLSGYMNLQKMEQTYQESLEFHNNHQRDYQLLDEQWVDIDNELSEFEGLLNSFDFREFDDALTEANDAFLSTGQLNMNDIDQLRQLDGFLREDVITLTNLKNSQPHLDYLTRLSYLHLQLTDISNQVAHFKHSLNATSSVQHLSRLKAMPTAYVSLLCELTRRTSFENHFKDKVSDVAELLANESRKEEIRRLALVDFRDSSHSLSATTGESFMKLAAVKPSKFLPFDVGAFDGTTNKSEVSLRGGNLVRISVEELQETIESIRTAVDKFIDSERIDIDSSAILPLFSVYESTMEYIHNLDLEWEKRASGMLLPQTTMKFKASNDVDQIKEDYEYQISELKDAHAAELERQRNAFEKDLQAVKAEATNDSQAEDMKRTITNLEERLAELVQTEQAAKRELQSKDAELNESKREHAQILTARDKDLRNIRSEMDADNAVLSHGLEMSNQEVIRLEEAVNSSQGKYIALCEALEKVLNKGADKNVGGGGINNVLMNFSKTPFDTDDVIHKLSTYVRRWQKEAKVNRERAKEKLAFRNFTRGDLALFLPTRNAAAKPWAAFNISFPHYFLKPTQTQAETLKSREWTVARIANIDEKVVEENSDNPFGLGVGVKYFLLDVEIWQPKHRRNLAKMDNLSGDTSNPFNAPEDSPKESSGQPDRLHKRRTMSTASSVASSRTRSSVGQQPPPNLLSQSPGVTTTLTKALSEEKKEDVNHSPIVPTPSPTVTTRNDRSGSGSVTGAAQDLLRNSLKRQQQNSPSM